MRKITNARYSVRQGETITITATPIGVGPNIVVWENDFELFNIGSTATPAYEFDVEEMIGNTHFVEFHFDFPASLPGSARFELKFESSSGIRASPRAIRKKHANHEPIYQFTVIG